MPFKMSEIWVQGRSSVYSMGIEERLDRLFYIKMHLKDVLKSLNPPQISEELRRAYHEHKIKAEEDEPKLSREV